MTAKWCKTLSVVLLVSLAAACGVKNDLVPPSGQKPLPGQSDPSKPPAPIGQ